ncbi:MAG: hypothetical protein U5L96_13180 [Owenweeksia sp.]|nr:hypothetical protein [Owenweeksia sp.]
MKHKYQPSNIGDYQRLKYLENKPKTYLVPYYDKYRPTDSVRLPKFYVLPQAWHRVARLLQANQIALQRLPRDTTLEVYSYYIDDFEFAKRPYEGHFPVQKLTVEKRSQSRHFLKGDYLISTDQPGRRFMASVLEPTASDSYLRWNFFDEIFQQKEYFSPYIFEETARQLLASDGHLQEDFSQWKAKNPDLASQPYATLSFIYKRSQFYEKEHLRYPVARID